MSRFTLAALMTVAMLSACSSTEVVAPTVSISEGAINQAEYDSLQKRILARPN